MVSILICQNIPRRCVHKYARPVIALLLVLSQSFATHAAAQGGKREHFTPEEIELVRDNQELDRRTALFVKTAERRLAALLDPQAAQSKATQKDVKEFGELPKSTRAQLLTDIAGIFDEAITNVDDAAQRNEKNPLLPKSVRQLAEAATRFLAQLAPLRETAAEGAEREALEQTFDELQEILTAASKLPAEVPDAKGKSKH